MTEEKKTDLELALSWAVITLGEWNLRSIVVELNAELLQGVAEFKFAGNLCREKLKWATATGMRKSMCMI